MYAHIEQMLAAAKVVITDGGTGTEIQRRGVPMHDEVWCAEANLTHPEVVREVHEDYIRAGADVIIANTFATSPLSFFNLGRHEEIPDIDRKAVRIAHDAVDAAAEKPIAVAGSFSVMRSVPKGTDRTTSLGTWTETKILPVMKRKAEALAAAGCDLIIMEMMRDIEQSLWATEAAVATGLPVWVGISVERREDGRLAGFGDLQWTMDDIVPVLMATGAHACLVMHHEASLTEEALKIIQKHWAGPVGAYPESGRFKMPNWEFGDMTPEEFVQDCRDWTSRGATILGGCCGIGPEHIAALAKAFDGTEQRL